MPFFEKGPVRLHYAEAGSGVPLLIIPGGGLNSSIAGLDHHVFNPMERLRDVHRCISYDLRNSTMGESSGPLEIDRPWDAHAEDQLGLMDQLGIDRFMVMGFCIGGPMAWKLLSMAPDRVAAAVLIHPSGFNPDAPDYFYERNTSLWGPQLCERRPDISMEMIHTLLTNMYSDRADFVFSVTREFVRQCQTPVLILPEDTPPHPYATAREAALLAPNGQMSLYPWKDSAETIPLALRHVDTFLAANRLAA